MSPHSSTSEMRALIKIKILHGWQSRNPKCKNQMWGAKCLCSHEHILQCDRPNTSFPGFKSKLGDLLPRHFGAAYQSRTVYQSMFEWIEDSYRWSNIWLGSSAGRCRMAGFFKNHEDYMVKMKMKMGLITGCRWVRTTLHIIWDGWRIVINSMQDS